MRFDENAINLGVAGIKNVMRYIDMLSKEPIQEITPIFPGMKMDFGAQPF